MAWPNPTPKCKKSIWGCACSCTNSVARVRFTTQMEALKRADPDWYLLMVSIVNLEAR